MRIVAGSLRGRALKSPPDGAAIRPTADRVREAIFDLLASRLGGFAGLAVLDLFAGTGAMGIEAVSRGAGRAVLVDTGVLARGLIRDNVEALGLGGVVKLLRRDATALGDASRFGAFDLVFLDPPYGEGLGEKALVSARLGGWLKPGATLVLEDSVRATLTLPAGFVMEMRRDYGAAAVHLLTHAPAL